MTFGCIVLEGDGAAEKGWKREERKVQSGVYVISPLRQHSFIFQTQGTSTNDVVEWQRAGWVDGSRGELWRSTKRRSDRCRQCQSGPASHQRLQRQCSHDIHGLKFQPRRALWSDEHPAGTCSGASAALPPNSGVRPVNPQATQQQQRPLFDQMMLVFHLKIMTWLRVCGGESCWRCSVWLACTRSRRLVCRIRLAELWQERLCNCEGREPESVGSSSAKAAFKTDVVHLMLQEIKDAMAVFSNAGFHQNRISFTSCKNSFATLQTFVPSTPDYGLGPHGAR